MEYNLIEALAMELKSLVSRGAKPHLIWRCGTIRELVRSKYPHLETEALKQRVVDEIRLAVDELVMLGRKSHADAVRELLALDEEFVHHDVIVRREKAIALLNAGYCESSWRKRPELDFMRKFAKVFLSVVSPPEAL